MFSKEDGNMIQKRGSKPEKILQQMERFKTGFPYADLIATASIGNGIILFTEKEKKELAAYFDKNKSNFDICRFVPASGAATRMFKSLFSVRDQLKGLTKEEQAKTIQLIAEAKNFFDSLSLYPFYNDLPDNIDFSHEDILNFLLEEAGLNYGNLPKGLIKFHKYEELSRTAFEEHLHEAVRIIGPGTMVKLHFTVSEEHLPGFKSLEKEIVPILEKHYDVAFELSYSFQKKETDTLAVELNNSPFREENGELVFRPGGHGALLENLNDLGSDIIFINNIDNVSPDKNSDQRVLNKKVLGGLLLKSRITVNKLLAELEKNSPQALEEAIKWLKNMVYLETPDEFDLWTVEDRNQYIIKQLDRPLRVCGMVKNEGQPGGGPFFVRNSHGIVSLQIVEASQIDVDNQEQASLLEKSSHFNPVDIVCSIRKSDDSLYNLPDYVDHNTGFISLKSIKGRDLKALELPGLWNGSMEGWNTIFIEIPAETFTPVKTIFDLIHPSHCNYT